MPNAYEVSPPTPSTAASSANLQEEQIVTSQVSISTTAVSYPTRTRHGTTLSIANYIIVVCFH